MTRITQQNLESYLWGAAALLRGTIDAGDYKQFIFPLLDGPGNVSHKVMKKEQRTVMAALMIDLSPVRYRPPGMSGRTWKPHCNGIRWTFC